MKLSNDIKAIFAGEEIILKDLWNVFWSRKKYVLISTVFFGLLGILAASTSPSEYEAKCILLGEGASGGGSGSQSALQGLAGMAGLDLASSSGGGSSGGAIGSDLYPLVLSSNPFLLELGADTIHRPETKESFTLHDYFQNNPPKANIVNRSLASLKSFLFGIPSKILGGGRWFFGLFKSKKENVVLNTTKPREVMNGNMNRNDSAQQLPTTRIEQQHLSNSASIARLTADDQAIINTLKTRISLKQGGRQIILSVKMPEARLSAEATTLVLNKLIEYVTIYKTSKLQETFKFLEARKTEAEFNYKNNQQKVAGFKDNNYNVVFQSVQSKEQQLQNEFTLSFGIYNQFATQLEQTRIELKKETPLFTVLEPVYIPSASSEPNFMTTFLFYIGIGFFGGMLFIVYSVVKSYFSTN